MKIKFKCGWCGKPVERNPSATKPRGKHEYIAYCCQRCRILGRQRQSTVAMSKAGRQKRVITKQPSGYRIIGLGNGYTVAVDSFNYEWLNQFAWWLNDSGYAIRNQKPARMHRVIVEKMIGKQLKPSEHIDHIDGNPLNNRQSNLRVVTNQQNRYNQRPKPGASSRYKGVFFNKEKRRWCTKINADKIEYTIGYFDDEIEAALAYDSAAIQLQGEFAWLNFIGR